MIRKKLFTMALLMLVGMFVGALDCYAYEYTGGTRQPETITISADPSNAWNEDVAFTNDSSIFTVNSPSAEGKFFVGQEITLSVTLHKFGYTVLPGGFSSNIDNNFIMTILKGDSVEKTFRVDYNSDDIGKTWTSSFTPNAAGAYKINVFYRGSTYSGSNYGNYYIQVAKGAEIGSSKKVSGQTYKVLTNTTVAFTQAANKASVTVPGTVKINGKAYKVTQINKAAFKGGKIRTVTIGANTAKIAANAFKGSKATKIVLKTKKLTQKTVKNALKGSKIKTVQVKVNKSTLNKCKKIFVKKVVGITVTVK